MSVEQEELNYPVVTPRGKQLFKEQGGLSKRDVLRERVIDYLGDPDNDVPVSDEPGAPKLWDSYANISHVFGYKGNRIAQTFTKQDLHGIEKEALELRRKRFAKDMKRIDDSLLNRAIGGDVPAIKLAYQRFEGWSEKTTLAGDRDNPVELSVTHLLDQVENSGRKLPGKNDEEEQVEPAEIVDEES